MRQSWWKFLTVGLLMYTLIGGLLLEVPRLPILNETIRALHFHVTMWFGMILMLLVAAWNSVKYLRSNELKYDDIALEFTNAAILFGVLGIVTGMLWAKFTWGDYWSGDPKQNASAIGLLMYFAYLVLRGSLSDAQQRGRIAAVYNLFAFAAFIPLIFVLPRLKIVFIQEMGEILASMPTIWTPNSGLYFTLPLLLGHFWELGLQLFVFVFVG